MMPVNEKMIRASSPEASWVKPHRNAEQVAQAVVNAAWLPYREDQESTWPDEGHYLTMDDRTIHDAYYYLPDDISPGWRNDEGLEMNVLYYAPITVFMKELNVPKSEDGS